MLVLFLVERLLQRSILGLSVPIKRGFNSQRVFHAQLLVADVSGRLIIPRVHVSILGEELAFVEVVVLLA